MCVSIFPGLLLQLTDWLELFGRNKHLETMSQKQTTELVAVIVEGYYRSGKGTFVDDCRSSGQPVFETGLMMRSMSLADPHNPAYEPIRKGHPVSSGLAMNIAKQWLVGLIKNSAQRQIVYFDSIPRLPDQIPFVDFLKERGYRVKCVWFTTPEHVCDARPARPDRPEDNDPVIRQNRRDFYRNGTLKVLDHFRSIGMSEATGDLLEIDNTHLTKEETRTRIKQFLAGDHGPAHAAHSAVGPQHLESFVTYPVARPQLRPGEFVYAT